MGASGPARVTPLPATVRGAVHPGKPVPLPRATPDTLTPRVRVARLAARDANPRSRRPHGTRLTRRTTLKWCPSGAVFQRGAREPARRRSGLRDNRASTAARPPAALRGLDLRGTTGISDLQCDRSLETVRQGWPAAPNAVSCGACQIVETARCNETGHPPGPHKAIRLVASMVSSLNNVLSNETKHRDQRRQNTARALARGGPDPPAWWPGKPGHRTRPPEKASCRCLTKRSGKYAPRIRLTGSLTARDALPKK